MRTSLIGRDEELELVVSRLGSGESVLVAGVAGVGKTRLSREVLDRLEASGREVRRAFATAAAATVAFGPLASVLPEGSDAGADRLDVLRHAVRGFKEAGCVLYVDDAHLLDDLSAAVVHQSATKGVPMLLTIRTGESVPGPITALWKDGLAERVELQALSMADTERLLAELLDGQPSGRMVDDIYSASRGNPLFVKETTAEALRRGILRNEGGVWTLSGPAPAPAHLADLVAEHIGALDDAALGALRLLAVAGELGLRSLEGMCDASALAVLDREGLIEVVSDGNRRVVRPAHSLFGEVVRSQLPPLAVADIQRALAAELQRRGCKRKGDAIRAAALFLDADGTAPTDLLLRAMHEARLRFDSSVLIRFARAAIQAGGGAEAAFGLATALHQGGQHEEAEEVFAGIDLLDIDGEHIRAAAASRRARNLGITLHRFDEARRVLRDARPHIGDWGDYLKSVEAGLVLWQGRLDEAEACVRDVPPEPRGGRLACLFELVMVMAVSGRCQQALDLIESAPSDPRLDLDRAMRIPRVIALAALGRLSEAVTTGEDSYRSALTGWGTEMVADHAYFLGRAELARGHVRSAARWFREALALHRANGDRAEIRWCLGGVAAALAMSGDVAGSIDAAAELDALDGGPILLFEPDMIPLGRAWARAAEGKLAEARVEIERGLPIARQTQQAVAEITLLHHHKRLGGEGDPSRMAELAAAIGGDLFPLWVAAPDARSQLDAAERLQEIGADLDAAETALRAAAGGRTEGLRRITQAAARLASSSLARCEGARTPALHEEVETIPLTGREREIATLAASGWSSKKIADHLVLSVRTVENHLQRTYEKLGVKGRDELPGALGRL